MRCLYEAFGDRYITNRVDIMYIGTGHKRLYARCHDESNREHTIHTVYTSIEMLGVRCAVPGRIAFEANIVVVGACARLSRRLVGPFPRHTFKDSATKPQPYRRGATQSLRSGPFARTASLARLPPPRSVGGDRAAPSRSPTDRALLPGRSAHETLLLHLQPWVAARG